ncbi:MAG: hypothetical protein ACOC05_01850 [Oceanicaulis sp.]
MPDMRGTPEQIALSRSAANAVGAFEPTADWRLEPERHAGALPPKAGALSRILQRPELQGLMRQFSEADARAGAAQRRYKGLGGLSIRLNALAILLGAIGLAGPDVAEAAGIARPPWAGSLVALIQFVCIAGAMVAAWLIIKGKPFDRWMRARAIAETCRMELFTQITSAQEKVREGELPLLPLQLEYFRRYQLGVQLDYYAGRGAQHRKTADARAARGDLYVLIGSLALAPVTAGAAAFIADPQILTYLGDYLRGLDASVLSQPLAGSVLVMAGLFAPALMSAQGALSLLSQDRRNASRYEATFDNLAHLSRVYLDAARIAAVRGDRETVQEFIDAVNAQISSEHQEWVRLQDEDPRPDFETIASARLPRLHRRSEHV